MWVEHRAKKKRRWLEIGILFGGLTSAPALTLSIPTTLRARDIPSSWETLSSTCKRIPTYLCLGVWSTQQNGLIAIWSFFHSKVRHKTQGLCRNYSTSIVIFKMFIYNYTYYKTTLSYHCWTLSYYSTLFFLRFIQKSGITFLLYLTYCLCLNMIKASRIRRHCLPRSLQQYQMELPWSGKEVTIYRGFSRWNKDF